VPPFRDLRFALAWSLPLLVGPAALHVPWAAWPAMLALQVVLSLVVWLAPRWRSPAAEPVSCQGLAWCRRAQVPWRAVR
jgi:hypothetical protein